MHVSVTTLGAAAGERRRAADQIVGYLEGKRQSPERGVEHRRSRPGSMGPDTSPIADALARPGLAGGYYADAAEAPGRWRGLGAGPDRYELGATVEPEAFRRVLLGQDPHTGRQLVAVQQPTAAPSSTAPRDKLTMPQAAAIVGVDDSYLRRIARQTAGIRALQAAAAAAGELRPELPATYLDAVKVKGRWLADRAEVERFAAQRREPQVVMGYDITWSAPKSVSMLYAGGDEALRQQIDAAIESAVSAGMSYLEAEGFHVRAGRGRERAGDMLAASYRHTTNRALEPQMHEHVVVANMATTATGQVRAVDARGLYAHATPAGYLAGAQLRYELRQAGIAWGPTHKGLADVAGIERDEIMAMSSRRRDVLTLADELGFHTPQARQKAALASRPGKDTSVDRDELFDRWRQMLEALGIDHIRIAELTSHEPAKLWRPVDTERLFGHLAGAHGVTEQTAIFDRRDVIKAVAEHATDRLPAIEIVDLADQWLTSEAVIELDLTDRARRETIGTGAGQVSLSPDERRYSAPEMVAAEQRVIDWHRGGVRTGKALVDPARVEVAITATRTTKGIELGADQAAMVRGIMTSGDQFQAVRGLAGAGKTTAIVAAVEAWQDAGYTVLGAAPFAEAARTLEAETGLRSQTLEGLLHRIELAGDPRDVLGPSTVVIVDEASTIGSRQLHRLYRAAYNTGASVRTIGDPLQHQSVEAGGLWQHLTVAFADRTPVLDTNRRQSGPAMAEVRAALDQYRQGLIAAALERLDDDNRIVVAPTWDALLDQMTADWYLDHQRHGAGHSEASKMIAERNADRHALNRRAQQWLRSDGTLTGGIDIAEETFHVGDRIVAQRADRQLRRPDGAKRDHVINGSQGTVVAIRGSRSAPDLEVDFDGLGPIRVPHRFVADEVGPGRGGGLTLGYAVTSYKAEGQTYAAGRSLAAPGTVGPEGMYVALTRGRHDLRIYSIAPADQALEPPELPIIPDPRDAREALADALGKHRGTDVATVADPDAATMASLTRHQLADLDALTGPNADRARQILEERIVGHATANPSPDLVALLGPRPDPGPHRITWDTAAGQAALYHQRWGADPFTPPPQPSPQAQRDGHLAVRTAIDHARVAKLENDALPELHKLRYRVVDALGTDLMSEQRAAADVAHAAEAVHVARQAAGRAHTAATGLAVVGHGVRFVDPDRIESARRAAAEAQVTAARARLELANAQDRLAATRGDPTARARLAETVSVIDRAVDARIVTAVKRPAPYLQAALGPRPHRDDPRRHGWSRAASDIEAYRHKALGLTPADGPRPGKGILSAIGPRPRLPLLQGRWDRTHQVTQKYLENPLRPDSIRLPRIPGP